MYNNDVINNLYVEGNNNTNDSDMTNDTMMTNNSISMPQMSQQPIMGQVQEKVVHRTFVHDVPHICPIHTRVINHHVYRHTYQPRYTCSEENCVSNVQCGSCCQFQ